MFFGKIYSKEIIFNKQNIFEKKVGLLQIFIIRKEFYYKVHGSTFFFNLICLNIYLYICTIIKKKKGKKRKLFIENKYYNYNNYTIKINKLI